MGRLAACSCAVAADVRPSHASAKGLNAEDSACECSLVCSPYKAMKWDECLTEASASSTQMVELTAVQAMLACRPAAIAGL